MKDINLKILGLNSKSSRSHPEGLTVCMTSWFVFQRKLQSISIHIRMVVAQRGGKKRPPEIFSGGGRDTCGRLKNAIFSRGSKMLKKVIFMGGNPF